MFTIWLPTESDRVCSSHFDPAMKTRYKTQVRLLAGAVPGITARLPNAEVKNDTHDHTYALPDAKILERRLDVLVNKVRDNKTKRDSSMKREKRVRLSMASMLDKLKDSTPDHCGTTP